MKEYISRDDALNWDMNIEVPPDSIQAVTTGMTMLMDYIKSIPAADVEERKHGKWTHEYLTSTSGGCYPVIRCSWCRWEFPMSETIYCPHCGADMRQKDGD